MASRPVIGVEELIRRKVASMRYWRRTKLYKMKANWKFKFSVMTYNILSQTAVENHRYLYRNCNPSFLTEDYRISVILPEILRSKSDIICLQEVEEFVYETRMRKVLECNGFGCIFMRRTTCKTDGCAIAWRREKFGLVEKNEIQFRTRNCQLLDRDNIGLIAVLKPKNRYAEGVLLHVATTHLLFNPRRGDVKLCQLRWLLAELDKMALIAVEDDVRRYHPAILCGDFNFEPNSPLYSFVENGSIDVRNVKSGDLSGQHEGRNNGQVIKFESLSLHRLGISKSSRFEKMPLKESHSSLAASLLDLNPSNASSLGHPKSVETSDSLDKKEAINLDEVETDLGMDSSKNPVAESEEAKLLTHGFNFAPAYKFFNFHDKKSIPVTSMVGNESNTVDHIFYTVDSKRCSQTFREGVLKLLSVYTLVSAEDIKSLGGLPNACLGSDHISLGAQFAICLQNKKH